MMEHVHANWNVPEVNNPGCDVRFNYPATGSSALHYSVPPLMRGCRPNPAPICDCYFLPKPTNERWRKSLRCEEFNSIVRPLDKLHNGNRVVLPEVTGLAGAFH
jgi:hypothetical protein